MEQTETKCELKRCSKCGVEYPKTEEYFYFRKDTNKFRNRCKECIEIGREDYLKEYRKTHEKERRLCEKTIRMRHFEQNVSKSDSEIFDGTIKICPRCGQGKPKTREFWTRDNSCPNGIYKACKTCKKIPSHKYEEKNRDTLREKAKIHARKKRATNYEQNAKKSIHEIFDGTTKKCYHCKQKKPRLLKFWARCNNSRDGIREVCRECSNKHRQERSRIDPAYRLRNVVSQAIRNGLTKGQGSKKGSSILKKLPYTMQQLRDHLESLWEPWMSWDNYGPAGSIQGTWQIDHVVPQSLLPYDSMDHPNFKLCWALNNLQPMETIDNIHKSNSGEE